MKYAADMSFHAAKPAVSATSMTAELVRPHLGWWVSVLSGMTLLGILAWDERAYGLWARHVMGWLPRGALMGVFVVAVALHLGEAIYARRLARRSGGTSSAMGWFWQTLLLGYPSLRLLRRQANAG